MALSLSTLVLAGIPGPTSARTGAKTVVFPSCTYKAPATTPNDPTTGVPMDPTELSLFLNELKWACNGAVKNAKLTVKAVKDRVKQERIIAAGCPGGAVSCERLLWAQAHLSADKSEPKMAHQGYRIYDLYYQRTYRSVYAHIPAGRESFPAWKRVMHASRVVKRRS